MEHSKIKDIIDCNTACKKWLQLYDQVWQYSEHIQRQQTEMLILERKTDDIIAQHTGWYLSEGGKDLSVLRGKILAKKELLPLDDYVTDPTSAKSNLASLEELQKMTIAYCALNPDDSEIKVIMEKVVMICDACPKDVDEVEKLVNGYLEKHSPKGCMNKVYIEITNKERALSKALGVNLQKPINSKVNIEGHEGAIDYLGKLCNEWLFRFAGISGNQRRIVLITQISSNLDGFSGGNDAKVVLYHTQTRRCRQLLNRCRFIKKEYNGHVDVELIDVENNIKKYAEELDDCEVPVMQFYLKDGNNYNYKAKYEGYPSISTIQSYIGKLVTKPKDGKEVTISSGSNIAKVEDLKSVNKRELYSLGEYLLFLFTCENKGEGICQEVRNNVKKLVREVPKVKYEEIVIKGSHDIHKSKNFQVTHVPSLVFIRDGKTIGKHVGHMENDAIKKLLEKFAKSNQHNVGSSKNPRRVLVDVAGLTEAERAHQSHFNLEIKYELDDRRKGLAVVTFMEREYPGVELTATQVDQLTNPNEALVLKRGNSKVASFKLSIKKLRKGLPDALA